MSEDALEFAKSVAGAFDKIADVFQKLAGPLAEECGQILADNIKAYRMSNWVKVVTKTEKILRDADLPPNAVPPRLFLPILEASSVEDDETLQDLWAGLLATASQQTDSVSPSFIETLKQLTPDEARHLDHVYKAIQKTEPFQMKGQPVTPYAFTKAWKAPPGCDDTFERLGLIRRDYNVTLRTEPEPALLFQFVFTRYVVSFLEACNGPNS
jgi:hypothetical protein